MKKNAKKISEVKNLFKGRNISNTVYINSLVPTKSNYVLPEKLQMYHQFFMKKNGNIVNMYYTLNYFYN